MVVLMSNTRRWYHLVGSLVGILVMLAGVAILVFRNDGTSEYSFLGIGAVIFGTSGLGMRRQLKPGRVC